MTAKLLRLAIAPIFALLIIQPAQSCPFCSATGQTFLSESKQADLILFGTLSNAKREPGSFSKGTTDLTVEKVIKDHPIRDGRKKITIPSYIPPDVKPVKYLVFCEVFADKLDPYRGIAVNEDSKLGDYLAGAIALKDAPKPKQLAYFFEYLNDEDSGIANDALTEFGNSDYKDTQPLYGELDPDRITEWLKADPPAARVGLFGSMLGHCGEEKHAAALKELLDQAKGKRRFTGIDGLLAGYVMLKPEEGWDYLCELLDDPKQEFLLRYAGLRAVRFFWDYRPDVKSREDMVAAARLMLDQADIADLPIEDLRKWKRWETADEVLGLYDKESHDIPIVQRAVLKYALSMPDDNAQANALLKRAKADDAERVTDIEELLKLEQSALKATGETGGN